jgi:lysophospholipase L1-like esterase
MAPSHILRAALLLLASSASGKSHPLTHPEPNPDLSVLAAPAHPLEDRFAALVAGNVSLRIMPLGASITYGVGSSDGNGYRAALRTLLNDDGNPVDYVGSRANGTMCDNEVEGWPGYRISDVLEKAELSVPKTLPNLILINAGTNDCAAPAQGEDPAQAGERMLAMLEYLWSASPRGTIVLSTLLVNEASDECIRGINDQFRTLVEEQQARSKKVALADMRGPAGPVLADLVDGTHPGDEGFKKMADVWFAAIEDAASRGWIEEPQALPANATDPE